MASWQDWHWPEDRSAAGLWHALRASVPFQILLLVGLWWGALLLMRLAGLAQLAGVAGMFLLWIALINNWVPLASVRAGANWLIRHMLLFFIPAVLVILDHRELMGWIGVKLFLVIVLGTVVVMACTALSIEWCLRLHRHRQAMQRLRRQRLALAPQGGRDVA
ncbi:holin-like protein [Corticibacter populi]|nr:holin-like protein [Corticibacter populi]